MTPTLPNFAIVGAKHEVFEIFTRFSGDPANSELIADYAKRSTIERTPLGVSRPSA
jgi:hypothetical protein